MVNTRSAFMALKLHCKPQRNPLVLMVKRMPWLMPIIGLVGLYYVVYQFGGAYAWLAPLICGVALLIYFGLKGETGGVAGPWVGLAILLLILGPSFLIMVPGYFTTSEIDATEIAEGHYKKSLEAAPVGIEVEADEAGQFYVTSIIRNEYITMLVDTGASTVALSYADAEQLGFEGDKLKFDIPLSTANGQTFGAYVVLPSVKIRGIEVKGVQAIIALPDTLSVSLLGMTFLKQLTHFQVTENKLTLYQKKPGEWVKQPFE